MNVLENGIDSLKKSLVGLNNLDKSDNYQMEFEMKDIIIRLHHAIEALFKYLLTKENEYLIYSKLEDYFKQLIEFRYNNQRKEPEFNSIQFMDAVNRLIILYDLAITKDVYNQIKELNSLRNSITHFENDLSKFEVEHIIAVILKAIIPIFSKNIPGFDTILSEEGINSDLEQIYHRDEMWLLSELNILLDKIFRANEKINSYGKNINNIKAAEEKKKIDYRKCEVCGNKYFVSKTPVFNSGSIIDYLGSCNLCNFERTKECVAIEKVYKSGYEGYSFKDFIVHLFFDSVTYLIDKYGYNSKECEDLKLDLNNKLNLLKKITSEFLLSIIRKAENGVNDLSPNNIISFIDNDRLEFKDYGTAEIVLKCIYKVKNIIYLFYKICGYEWNLLYKVDKDLWLNNKNKSNIDEIDYEINSSINNLLIWQSKSIFDMDIFDEVEKFYNNKLETEVNYQVTSGEIWAELAGTTASDFGTIDNVDECYIDKIYLINTFEENDEIEVDLIIECEISTQLYTDHEFISNGSSTILIGASISYLDDTKEISKIDMQLLWI
jgi:hypothetical protein